MFCDGVEVFAVTPKPKRFNSWRSFSPKQWGIMTTEDQQSATIPWPTRADGIPSRVVCMVIVWLLVDEVIPPYSLARETSGVLGFETALVVPFAPVEAPDWTVGELFWSTACARRLVRMIWSLNCGATSQKQVTVLGISAKSLWQQSSCRDLLRNPSTCGRSCLGMSASRECH